MKTIEKFEVEYVVPETEAERTEIESLISQIKEEEQKGIRNLDSLKLIKKQDLPENGMWRKAAD